MSDNTDRLITHTAVSDLSPFASKLAEAMRLRAGPDAPDGCFINTYTSIYARIGAGVVAELSSGPPAGFTEYTDSVLRAWIVDITDIVPQPQPGWTAVRGDEGWTFGPPA